MEFHQAKVESLTTGQIEKEVQDARKAVFQKNNIINEMFNKQNEYMRIIEERDDEINELRAELDGS